MGAQLGQLQHQWTLIFWELRKNNKKLRKFRSIDQGKKNQKLSMKPDEGTPSIHHMQYKNKKGKKVLLFKSSKTGCNLSVISLSEKFSKLGTKISHVSKVNKFFFKTIYFNFINSFNNHWKPIYWLNFDSSVCLFQH